MIGPCIARARNKLNSSLKSKNIEGDSGGHEICLRESSKFS